MSKSNKSTEAAKSRYELTIDLNTLNHLGIGLYSNIPAVISEVVANAYDADAHTVKIQIDTASKTISIEDDGWGMTQTEINSRFLKVGYSKRRDKTAVNPKGRLPMGRKGIGKLALFAVADVIEVHSVKLGDTGRVLEQNGFIMDAQEIKRVIEGGSPSYSPQPVESSKVVITKGTTIILRNLKKGVDVAGVYLRKRLARRFSIIGVKHNFEVFVDGEKIAVDDRDYFGKIQYLWCVGKESEEYVSLCKNCRRHETVDGVVDKAKGYEISGWVGTLDEQKSVEEGNNTIVVLARGKLVHEDLLKDLKEGGVFTKYLIGEIRADFLDLDTEEDVATSDRQSIKEDDPRFLALKSYVQDTILAAIGSRWRDWRKEDATEKALLNPKIKAWFESLPRGHKKYAKALFEKIESFPIQRPDDKKELYRHGILAFESLAIRDSLDLLEKIDTNKEFEQATELLANMDELEAAHYWQITRTRVAALKKFQEMVPTAKEKFIQKHIFDHLWLLDPSWERASTDKRVEQSVRTAWKKTDTKLPKKKKDEMGRVDIRYRTAAGKHIIVELKRYDRTLTATELVEQISKYRRDLESCLKNQDPEMAEKAVIEIICILGHPPKPVDEDKRNRDILTAAGARYITYDQLIQQTRDSYADYLNKQEKISRIQKLIDSL
jgi:hypothetical protein